jgi:hypothetical protein
MRKFPQPVSVLRALFVTTLVSVLATTAPLAQVGSFEPSFDGELWGVRHELLPGGGAIPAGVVFADGKLFVADSENQTLIAYDAAGVMQPVPGAEWDTANPLSPVAGLIPHQLTKVVVRVDGTDRPALLISDLESNRVAAFETTGAYLFALRLQRPTTPPTVSLSTGQMAMSPGATFNVNTATSTLTLSGSFAAAWREQQTSGSVHTAALVFDGASAIFTSAGTEFVAAATSVLTGTESNATAPPPQYMFGVTFDTAGNLYVQDAVTERLHVYGPDLSRLFTFGTPLADGTTAEFQEPWGLAFWPDAAGTSGRIFVNDTYNNRIMIYRPVDGDDADTVIDGLQFETVIEHFVAPEPVAIELSSIALDPASATIAVTDFAQPRVVVLQRPQLAAFNLQVLDAADAAVSHVCRGTTYQVRFSLTVPAGFGAVDGVTPILTIDGAPQPIVDPAVTIQPNEVVTYTFPLNIAPDAGLGDLAVEASANSTSTSSIGARSVLVPLSDCSSAPPTIAAASNLPPQVSGWTPVYAGEMFTVTLTGTAAAGEEIDRIEYKLTGTNNDGLPIAPVPGAEAVVALPEMGSTTIAYRAWDTNNVPSGWQQLEVRLVSVVDRLNVESDRPAFTIGAPAGSGYVFSATGLPFDVRIDPGTGHISGVVSFESAGVYNVTVTETLGGASSSVSFVWTIKNVNRHPTIAPVAPLTLVKGTPFTLPINGSDPDGDTVFWTVTGRSIPTRLELPATVSLDPATGVLSGVFGASDEQGYVIFVGLSECSGVPGQHPVVCAGIPLRDGLATLSTITVTLVNTNQPPAVLNPGTRSNTEGDTITPLQIVASDPDLASGDSLTFSATNLPPGLSIDAGTGVITGTIGFNADRVHAVMVTVRDEVGALPLPFVSFEWLVADKDLSPIVVLPDRENAEGDVVTGALTGTHPAGLPLTYTAIGLPPGVLMNAAGVLSGHFDFNAAGTYTVTVRASDGTLSTADTFTWIVHNVNRHPVLTVQNQVSAEGDTVSVAVGGNDPDGDPLTFHMNGLPAGFSINASTGLMIGTFDFTSAGTYTVNVVLSEPLRSVEATFTWTVIDTNRPPVVAPIATRTNAAGDAVIVSLVVANDPDGTALTYGASGLPPGLLMNPTTGVISGTIASTAEGTYTVTVRASDDAAFDEETFAWIVTPILNVPPICTAASTRVDMWPSNHKERDVTITGVTDPDGGTPRIQFTSILQDEPTDSEGQGNTRQDAGIESNGARAWVRAERTGTGDGRVYIIAFIAIDGHDASCSGTVSVGVSHDQSKPAVLSGGRWNAITGQLVTPPPAIAVAKATQKPAKK